MNVGISLDGVPAVNDKRRVDYRGKGTSERVAMGIKKLQHYNILYGALIVVDREVYQTDMREMLNHFISIDLTGIEFLNIVPDNRLAAGEYIGNNFISYAEFIKFLIDASAILLNFHADMSSEPRHRRHRTLIYILPIARLLYIGGNIVSMGVIDWAIV
ncbi:putative heme-binding protein [Yersinia aldovae]|uniref:Heme-binding protein n=1 Tax=Yersinia aldovae TaxID=29483 RepID=A0ABM9SRG4_YERAL|nr:putative heme-binding protein [Yersinia aldovae]